MWPVPRRAPRTVRRPSGHPLDPASTSLFHNGVGSDHGSDGEARRQPPRVVGRRPSGPRASAPLARPAFDQGGDLPMGLPAVTSYPMPAISAVPVSPPPSAIDPSRAALLIHDVQNHFVDAFPAECSPVVELIDNISTLRELAGTLGTPVVFSAEPAPREPDMPGVANGIWGPADRGPGPDAAGIVGQLAPRTGEHVLINTRHNAFLRSHLGRLLRSTGRDQLILCGVRAHLGI